MSVLSARPQYTRSYSYTGLWLCSIFDYVSRLVIRTSGISTDIKLAR